MLESITAFSLQHTPLASTCFTLMLDIIKRNQINVYRIINNLKLFLLMGTGLATNIREIIEGKPDLLVICFVVACKAFGQNAHSTLGSIKQDAFLPVHTSPNRTELSYLLLCQQ